MIIKQNQAIQNHSKAKEIKSNQTKPKQTSSNKLIQLFRVPVDWPNEYCVHQWCGSPEFNPRSSHTKNSKNGTWCHLA